MPHPIFLIFFIFILLINLPFTAHASSFLIDRYREYLTPQNEVVLDVTYQNHTIGQITAYEYHEGVMLPLGSLASVLGFSINVDTENGLAQGSLIRKGETFSSIPQNIM